MDSWGVCPRNFLCPWSFPGKNTRGAISYSISYHLCLCKQNSGQEKHSTEDPYKYTLSNSEASSSCSSKEKDNVTRGTPMSQATEGRGLLIKTLLFRATERHRPLEFCRRTALHSCRASPTQWFSPESERGEFKYGNDIASCASRSRQLGVGKYYTCQHQFPRSQMQNAFRVYYGVPMRLKRR